MATLSYITSSTLPFLPFPDIEFTDALSPHALAASSRPAFQLRS